MYIVHKIHREEMVQYNDKMQITICYDATHAIDLISYSGLHECKSQFKININHI